MRGAKRLNFQFDSGDALFFDERTGIDFWLFIG